MEKDILHLLAEENTTAVEILARQTNLSKEEVLRLIAFGALYINKLRCLESHPVQTGDYLRLHKNPRRFPINWNWKNLCLIEEADFVILQKPSGLPCHPTLDNYKENLLYQMSEYLGKSLLLTHRLDQMTAGLIVYAKNKNFQTEFNQMLANKEVSKTYQVFTEKPLTPGHYTHYMTPSHRSPKKLSSTPNSPNDKDCQLEILSCEKKEISSSWKFCDLYESKQIDWSTSYCHEVQLITGRTHQIRAQFSQLGAPILGDSLYGGTPSLFFGLLCTHLSFSWKQNSFSFPLNHQ